MKLSVFKFMIQFRFILPIMVAFNATGAFPQQVNIPRIEMMPNQPSPYEMRNWQQVALGYDSLIFNFQQSGPYLPLIWWNNNPINFPNHPSFGLHSYVGTYSPLNAEAINILPAVIGATLAGIDKSSQNKTNWVLMCEEFFNRRPEENVYLNNPVTESGNDWWYDTMPNIFFYQLYDLYPGIGNFADQFTTVADRWLEAVKTMGGSTTPWSRPDMNFRAWHLATMTPNNQGVREPEAAGAIAWLLYQAFVITRKERYRIGAEWAMEFLSRLNRNPAYELQLPYGAYVAARMNAELGTQFDLEKLVNWCFEVGPLRKWGAIVGNWGGYDCSGLIGEAEGEGNYAFAMNGFEQVGALVPMVRYDDRFARAIGKWVLNVANASRLFYSKFLPPEHQDNETWAYQYDPRGYIAYEALRRDWFGTSPYATGDAMRGGWAATNLGLYGSSHVGILGGIIDTTNVAMILQLDVLKTDYFHDAAYPTYLYFNPYSVSKTVEIDVGNGQHDIYDAVRNQFLLTGVSGIARMEIPADAAVLAVITPSAATISYDLNKMRVNGVVVDYRSGHEIGNYPPRIKSLAASALSVVRGESITLYSTAEDRDNDPISYHWRASKGAITGEGAQIKWRAPNEAGHATVTCVVSDSKGGQDSASVAIEVLANQAPVISALTATPSIIDVRGTSRLVSTAHDPDGDSLTYIWSAKYGSLIDSGAVAIWTAPEKPGYYPIFCRVEDTQGAEALDSVAVVAGHLVGYYPFDGHANDESGFRNQGFVSGAKPVPDRSGQPNRAYAFDGADDFIRIPNHPTLNFREAVSINFWMKVAEFSSREAFPISHGSWQNRWKVSIIPERRLRWTLKTDSGIVDLDSETILLANSWYNVSVTYGEGEVRIYLNGVLDATKNWSGAILPTHIDLTIGQMLPGNHQYGFRGEMDDIRIYNRVLSSEEIWELYNISTAVNGSFQKRLPATTMLYANFPNPFNPSTVIQYDLSRQTRVVIRIFNSLGQKVKTLVSATEMPGQKRVVWQGRDDSGRLVSSGIYIIQLKTADGIQQRKILLLR